MNLKMPLIISQERFISQSQEVKRIYNNLKSKFPKDTTFKKINRIFNKIKSLYFRDKIYAVKHLNYLEEIQSSFSNERHALIVRTIEILQKLILHKKLNKEDKKITKKNALLLQRKKDKVPPCPAS